MAEIRLEDLQMDEFHGGIGQPFHVRVTHIPTGRSAEASDRSVLRARERAITELRDQEDSDGR